jgi:mRNA interferase RelE/StbE
LAWKIDFSDKSRKQIKKLSRNVQVDILDYLEHRVAVLDNPRSRGEALTANKAGLWRYRVGDYRIICQIIDNKLIILVIEAGHRREVYK